MRQITHSTLLSHTCLFERWPLFITLAASSGKRNASVRRPSVRPSVCSILSSNLNMALGVFFLTLPGRAGRILNVTHQGAAHGAASIHFRLSITRTEILVTTSWNAALLQYVYVVR